MAFFSLFWTFNEYRIALGLREILIFFGIAHVPATLMFYLDRDFRSIARSDFVFYGAMPVAAVFAGALFFVASSPFVQAVALCLFWMWQAFHYGKQNIGVYAFSNIALGLKPARPAMKIAFTILAWSAVLGTLRILGTGVMPAAYAHVFVWLHHLGTAVFCVAALAAFRLFLLDGRRLFSMDGLMFASLVLFFTPLFLSDGVDTAFLSYAIAHGLQYLVFILVIANKSRKANNPLAESGLFTRFMPVLLVVVGLGVVFSLPRHLSGTATDPSLKLLIDILAGGVLGATIAHFILDARVWKLSRPEARAYITQKFDFVFAQPKRSAAE